MQSSGGTRREDACTCSSTVMPREGGHPVFRRRLGMNASGILDRPVEPDDDSEVKWL